MTPQTTFTTEMREQYFQVADSLLAELVPTHLAVEASMRSVLSAMLAGTWTSFEVLATDVWINAVNQRSSTLGLKAMEEAHRLKNSVGEPHEESRVRAKSLDAHTLFTRYGVDFSSSLGSVIYDRPLMSFNGMRGLRTVYKAAFGDDAKSLFDGFHELRDLESLRNVLVHRAGIADKRFCDRVKQSPRLSVFEERKRVRLDGEMVAHHANAAISAGVSLVLWVDQWLKEHPGDSPVGPPPTATQSD